jgi:hypothetical protein
MSSTGLIAPEAERVDYAHPNLDDEWELQNDNEFASSLFSALKKSDSFHFTEACATSHLCNQCQTIRDRLLLPGFSITYDTTVLAHRSAINECNLCSLLWKTCEQQGHFAYPTVTFERVGSSLRINGSGVPALSIYRSPNLKNPAADSIQISFAELPEAGQSTHLKLIREWLKHCDNEQNHPTCKRGSNTRDEGKRTVPTRLIDVGAIGDNRVRLVPTIGGDCGEWVALSHQWGAGPYFSTNRKNLMDHMEGINLSDLPPTFRDAVTVTRGVGLRYLWIDSICIIQGPDGDFNQEAKRMEGVYSNAYCVIAASRADNHYSGYLRQRRARESVVMSREKEAPFYICEVIDDFKTHVLDGGLNARGWVMQEHALARRTIFFTDHQTYWECGEGVWCETMIKMKNNLAAFLGDPNFPQILIDAPQGEKILRCQKLYQTYSRLGLSNPYDRPMAIDGLQRRLLRTMKAKGSFGVFDEGGARGLLRRSLLWHRGSDTQSLTRIKFPTNRSASAIPSWSWMAYTGAIDYLKLDFGGCKWMDIGTPWSGSADKVARTEDHASSIALTGEAKTYEYRPKDFNPNAAVQHEGLLLFDSPGGSEKLRTMCVVLGIEQGPKPLAERMHYLILIKPSNALVPESNKIYERVGAGYLPGKCIKPNGFKVIIH